MAVLTFTGFESGVLAHESVSNSGTLSLQSSVVRTGGYALLVNPTTTGTGYYVLARPATDGTPAAINVAIIYARFYFRWGTLPSSGDEEIFHTSRLNVRLDHNGKLLTYTSSGTLLSTGTTALSSGTWYRIEVKISIVSTTLSYEVKINGSSEYTGTTSVTSGSTTGTVALGKFADHNGQSVAFYYDDVLISDSAYPGDGQCVCLIPTGPGAQGFWSGSYTSLTDIPSDGDTSYISDGSGDNASLFTLTTAETAGINNTVAAVKTVQVSRYVTFGSGTGAKTRVYADSTFLDSATHPLTAAYAAYQFLQELEPSNDFAWTPTELDTLQIGPVSGSGSHPVRCSSLYAMVDHQPSAPTNVTVDPTGLGSTAAFGSPTITEPKRAVTPTGRVSTAAYGSPTLTRRTVATPTGRASTAAFGSPRIAPYTVGAVGIPPGAACGSPQIKPYTVGLSGVGPTSGCGSPTVTDRVTLHLVGVGSTAASGTLIATERITLSMVGAGSTSVCGSPTATEHYQIAPASIASTSAFGTLILTDRDHVAPVGIGSGSGVGSPSTITRSAVLPTGISSTSGTGSPTIGNRLAVSPTGVPSGDAFGLFSTGNLAHVAVAGLAASDHFGTLAVTRRVSVSPVGIGSGSHCGTPASLTYLVIITIPSGKVAADLVIFPLTLRLTLNKTRISAQVFLFRDSSGNPLPAKVVSYSTDNGVLDAIVRVNLPAATDTVIALRAG